MQNEQERTQVSLGDIPVVHPNSPTCRAVNGILSRIGDKWSVLIISRLGGGPRRFNEIKRMIDGVSQRMLTLTLRNLERDGLVKRTVTPTVPPRVDYQLTALGHDLLGPVSALSSWAIQNQPCIEAARSQFDRAQDAYPPHSGRL